VQKREELKVEKRSVIGKQVKKLRRDGIVPGNVYGRDIKSTAVQVPAKEFNAVFAVAHETGLVDLQLDGATIPVLIHNVFIHPKTRDVLHADFFKVNLKEKITANIPVVAVGEPKAVTDQVGLLEQPVGEIEVEALPTDLPENIEVNVEGLAQVGDQIMIEQLQAPAGVAILNEPSQVVFKIGELVTKEMEAQAAADEAEAAEAAAETAAEQAAEGGEATEGEATEEGAEAPTEEQPAEAAATEEKPAEEPKNEG
jgi:large subunit ribosomal protein L25